jgi:hypothetical protein
MTEIEPVCLDHLMDTEILAEVRYRWTNGSTTEKLWWYNSLRDVLDSCPELEDIWVDQEEAETALVNPDDLLPVLERTATPVPPTPPQVATPYEQHYWKVCQYSVSTIVSLLQSWSTDALSVFIRCLKANTEPSLSPPSLHPQAHALAQGIGDIVDHQYKFRLADAYDVLRRWIDTSRSIQLSRTCTVPVPLCLTIPHDDESRYWIDDEMLIPTVVEMQVQWTWGYRPSMFPSGTRVSVVQTFCDTLVQVYDVPTSCMIQAVRYHSQDRCGTHVYLLDAVTHTWFKLVYAMGMLMAVERNPVLPEPVHEVIPPVNLDDMTTTHSINDTADIFTIEEVARGSSLDVVVAFMERLVGESNSKVRLPRLVNVIHKMLHHSVQSVRRRWSSVLHGLVLSREAERDFGMHLPVYLYTDRDATNVGHYGLFPRLAHDAAGFPVWQWRPLNSVEPSSSAGAFLKLVDTSIVGTGVSVVVRDDSGPALAYCSDTNKQLATVHVRQADGTWWEAHYHRGVLFEYEATSELQEPLAHVESLYYRDQAEEESTLLANPEDDDGSRWLVYDPEDTDQDDDGEVEDRDLVRVLVRGQGDGSVGVSIAVL